MAYSHHARDVHNTTDFATIYQLIRKVAMALGVMSLLAAIVHGALWWSMKADYVAAMEAVLSPDGSFQHVDPALAWLLGALIIGGLFGIYFGLRDIDIFNLPAVRTSWGLAFLAVMAICAVTPLALGVKVRLNEDGILEWITFWASAGAGLIALFVAFKARSFLLGLAALMICFYAGEEISWGQRVFGFVTPEGLSKINHQQETNLHNLIKVLGLGYLVIFAAAALIIIEIRAILTNSVVSRFVGQSEQRLLISGVDLPFLAIVLLFIGLLAGYSNEYAEYLFSCCAAMVALRLLFISSGISREAEATAR